MSSRKPHPKSVKSKARPKSVKKAKSAKKAVQPLSPHPSALSPLSPPAHVFKLLLPAVDLPAHALPDLSAHSLPSSSTSPSSSAPMTDEQTLEMLSLGQRCYSILGQTRLFWGHLRSPFVEHEWLRFHFIQASLLSMPFFLLYAILGAGILMDVLGPNFSPFGLFEAAFLLAAILHMALFISLGQKALRGEVPMLPFVGPQAAMLAASGKPLGAWKL